jgi:5'-deoxynucleotidase YfbR-like HD superfamily hydrolase
MENRIMRTYTGKYFDPVSPSGNMISIVDIAHGLSMQARWCGQLEEFYSVAEHCVMVAEILESSGRSDLALAGLLHDAHEAYTSDIPSPVKDMLKPAITNVEARIDSAVFAKFGLEYPVPEEKDVIKAADMTAFYIEDRDLRGKTFPEFEYDKLPQTKADPVGPVQAKIKFMEKFMDLLEKAQDNR